MSPYVVLGAGAVGSAIGAYLARRGHEVILVARPAHARAIQTRGGLQVTTYDETFVVSLAAVDRLPETLPAGAVVLLGVQAPDVASALEPVADRLQGVPVVTLQNGIRAEETAARYVDRVYGGIVRFTATLLDPGEVRLRRPGDLIVGCHPSGVDATAEAIAADFRAAGFGAAATPDIAAEKALKLLVNLVSGPAVLMHRTKVEPDLARVQVALLEEGRAVFAAAGRSVEPVSGLGAPVDAMIARFRAGGSAPDGKPVYNSTWQNLHHRRPRLENSFYHGEIIALGEEHGIPTPVNERALALLEEVREQGLGPEPWTPEEFHRRFADVVDLDAPLTPPTDPGANLEI